MIAAVLALFGGAWGKIIASAAAVGAALAGVLAFTIEERRIGRQGQQAADLAAGAAERKAADHAAATVAALGDAEVIAALRKEDGRGA